MAKIIYCADSDYMPGLPEDEKENFRAWAQAELESHYPEYNIEVVRWVRQFFDHRQPGTIGRTPFILQGSIKKLLTTDFLI